MSPSIEFQYRFHAAGQGLFASGTLTAEGEKDGFHWVFDCGSVALQTVLAPVVSRYRDLVIGKHLDLLCISHFDYDHVSGLSDLLEGLHVDTVVIPYFSSIERLVLASLHPSPGLSYIAFLNSPIDFILERAASVRRFLIIGGPADDTEGLLFPNNSPRDPDDHFYEDPSPPRREASWDLKLNEFTKIDPTRVVDKETFALTQRMKIELLALTGPLEARAVNMQTGCGWEFLFFHKPIDPIIRETLFKKLQAIFTMPIAGRRIRNFVGALKSKETRVKIKKAYQSTIRGKENINSTSLCVYTGPLLDSFKGAWICPFWPDPLMAHQHAHHIWHKDSSSRCSLLYTGDANFKRPENRQELRDFVTLVRWRHIVALQVPHHGSKNNWEAGAAAEFDHLYSIFCADETHRKYKHPDKEVVLDLMYRGPILANKVLSWNLVGLAEFF